MTETTLWMIAAYGAGNILALSWLAHQLFLVEEREVDTHCMVYGLTQRMDALDRRIDRIAPMVTMEVP